MNVINISEYLEELIDLVMDSIEEFSRSVTKIKSKCIIQSFFVSLIFLILSIIMEVYGTWCFIHWKEALMCTVIILILALVDISNRSKIAKDIINIKRKALSATAYIKKQNVRNNDEDEHIEENSGESEDIE